jgi:hypothetical protein
MYYVPGRSNRFYVHLRGQISDTFTLGGSFRRLQ